MEHLWSIVGTGVRPQEETDFIVVHLFGDGDGLAASDEMDATMADLPGLHGLRIFRRARREAFARAGRILAHPPGLWKRAPELVVLPDAGHDALAR